jgi:CRP-like cAMP-binding protein
MQRPGSPPRFSPSTPQQAKWDSYGQPPKSGSVIKALKAARAAAAHAGQKSAPSSSQHHADIERLFGNSKKMDAKQQISCSPSDSAHRNDSGGEASSKPYLAVWKEQMNIFDPEAPSWFLFPSSSSPRAGRTVHDNARSDALAAAAIPASVPVRFHDQLDSGSPWAAALRAALPASPSSVRSPRAQRWKNAAAAAAAERLAAGSGEAGQVAGSGIFASPQQAPPASQAPSSHGAAASPRSSSPRQLLASPRSSSPRQLLASPRSSSPRQPLQPPASRPKPPPLSVPALSDAGVVDVSGGGKKGTRAAAQMAAHPGRTITLVGEGDSGEGGGGPRDGGAGGGAGGGGTDDSGAMDGYRGDDDGDDASEDEGDGTHGFGAATAPTTGVGLPPPSLAMPSLESFGSPRGPRGLNIDTLRSHSSMNVLQSPSEALDRAVASRHHLLAKMHLDNGLSDEQILGQLRKVRWFRKLSYAQLRDLYARASHKFFAKYSTVMREGNEGDVCFLLLQGKVRLVTAAAQAKEGVHKLSAAAAGPSSITLGPGACFGEDALLATMRREASALALDDCYLLQFEASQLQGLAIDLEEVRVHVLSTILQGVAFFRTLPQAERERMARISELQYLSTQQVVFSEGEPGDRLFVLVDGAVSVLKRGAEQQDEDEVEPQRVARYTPNLEMPWFGELALTKGEPRAATAVCDEPTKVLVVHAEHFAEFVEVVPLFGEMFAAAQKAYTAVNSLKSLGLNVGESMLDIGTGTFSTQKSTMPLTAAEGKWEKLTLKLLEAARLAEEGEAGGTAEAEAAASEEAGSPASSSPSKRDESPVGARGPGAKAKRKSRAGS